MATLLGNACIREILNGVYAERHVTKRENRAPYFYLILQHDSEAPVTVWKCGLINKIM